MNFNNMDLRGTRFHQTDLRNSTFSGANLTTAQFGEAKLDGCVFTDATLEAVDFSGAVAVGADFTKASVVGCSFEKADLTGGLLKEAVFTNCNFNHANLAQADLSGAAFIDCQLSATQLAGANLSRTSFRETPAVHSAAPVPVDVTPAQPESVPFKVVTSPAPQDEEPIPATVVIRTNLPFGFEGNSQAPSPTETQSPKTVRMSDTELSDIRSQFPEPETQQSFMDAYFTPLIEQNRELILESIKNSRYPTEFRVKISEGCESFRERFNLEKETAKVIWTEEFNRRIQALRAQTRTAAA